ncbi:unnamed protein product [Didymodactylos carnosus]|uniref:NAD(P)(+)--arginine ADP-ribosyltransferase n=1 Tax=Didymodactylos carnosus TaxID=1234261 RepID=A0A814ZPY5_9BILA|nr:unnamed protein product [Didymodactylos carnosus]CAF1563837.1 unnamed protein product [Didymodactylos carnosus]CAF4012313.1 unnamed protein product [Didymodactylos carnosus]CAF4356370.1 unnamed protein product [Didymodactylos carnosus]
MNIEQNDEPKWCWQSNSNPFLYTERPEWREYPSAVNEQIEKAFQSGEREVIINDQYLICFEDNLQINLHDSTKKRPVERCLLSEEIKKSSRRERFINGDTPEQFIPGFMNDDIRGHGDRFIREWVRIFGRRERSEIVDAAVYGIITEGTKEKQLRATKLYVYHLLSVRNQSMDRIQECCVRLYTHAHFLYRIVNKALRENDETKLSTLGPFCYLLYNFTRKRIDPTIAKRESFSRLDKIVNRLRSDERIIHVYRGEPAENINVFKRMIDNGRYKWSQFISTSKIRKVAADFAGRGGCLLVIQAEYRTLIDRGVDISSLSEFPYEEEVLLRPGVQFEVTGSEYDRVNDNMIFYVRILPSYLAF